VELVPADAAIGANTATATRSTISFLTLTTSTSVFTSRHTPGVWAYGQTGVSSCKPVASETTVAGRPLPIHRLIRLGQTT